MNVLDTQSLQNTVDHINEALLFGQEIPAEEKLAAARWIASRQGGRGAYRGSFAPTEQDFEQGIHCFSGEKLVYASARHILGEEAARAAWLLGGQDPDVRTAYTQATSWMDEVLSTHTNGTFCCGRCTIAFWRHLWAGEFEEKERFLSQGLQALRDARQGDGKWVRYPFYYTLYTLVDIDLPPVVHELKYARPAMEKALKYTRSDSFSRRRQVILEKALAQAA